MKNINELTITKHDGVYVIDSLNVAAMVGKRHDNLMRDIDGYVEIMESSNLRNDFFIPSEYEVEDSFRKYRCYLLTRKGCDVVANKITGKKGLLFTVTYVNKFEEMEKSLKKLQPVSAPISIEQMIIMQAQSVIDLKAKVEQQAQIVEQQTSQLTTLNHRMDNMDSLDTIGDPRQRLVNMVKKYAYDNKVLVPKAWKEFNQSYNTAYRTNIGRLKSEYAKSHNLPKVSTPAYLEAVGNLEDGIRVADKMLNPLAAR